MFHRPLKKHHRVDPDQPVWQQVETLTRVLGEDRGSLVIASTDLSHFHNDAKAKELDREFIRKVEAYDPEGLSRALSGGTCEACGGGPVVTAMIFAEKAGARGVQVLHYANSGDVTGERRQVVGYLSAAFYRESAGGRGAE